MLAHPIPFEKIRSLSANFPLFYIRPSDSTPESLEEALQPVKDYLAYGTYNNEDILNPLSIFPSSKEKAIVSIYDVRT